MVDGYRYIGLCDYESKMSVDVKLSSCQAVKLSRLSVKAFGVVKTKHPLSPG